MYTSFAFHDLFDFTLWLSSPLFARNYLVPNLLAIALHCTENPQQNLHRKTHTAHTCRPNSLVWKTNGNIELHCPFNHQTLSLPSYIVSELWNTSTRCKAASSALEHSVNTSATTRASVLEPIPWVLSLNQVFDRCDSWWNGYAVR